MGIKYRKSISIGKGVRVNVGKTGASVSLGTKGCRYTVHTSGRKTGTIGLPGTGLSYSHSSGGGKSKYNSGQYSQYRTNHQQQELQVQKQRQNEYNKNIQLVDEYENYICDIRNIHKVCKEIINWEDIFNIPEPFEFGCTGPNQNYATNQYNAFKATFIEKIFTKKRDYRKKKLYEKIETAKKEDYTLYENWKNMHELSQRIMEGRTNAYLKVIYEMKPFQDIIEYGSNFKFSTDNPSIMEIEFKVNSINVIPKISMSLTKTGKLSQKDLTKTQYYDFTQDYVCSCAIRLARDTFAILPVNKVIVNAVDIIVNTTNGHQEESTILSVIFDKQRFNNINFDRIDASDFVETFTHNMKFMKTSGFRPVERIN